MTEFHTQLKTEILQTRLEIEKAKLNKLNPDEKYFQPRKLEDGKLLREITERIEGAYLKPSDIDFVSSSKVLIVKDYKKSAAFDENTGLLKPQKNDYMIGSIIVDHRTVADDDAHRMSGYLLSMGPTAFKLNLWRGCDPDFYKPGDKIFFTKGLGAEVVINGIRCFITMDDDVHGHVGETATVESFLPNMGKKMDVDNLADSVIMSDDNPFEGLDN